MALAHRWSSRNLSRLELVVTMSLLGMFVAVFIGHGLRIFAAAEARAVQASVVNVESSLRMLFYQMMIEGRATEVQQWRGANPAELVQSFGALVDTETLVMIPDLARFGALSGSLGGRYLGEFESLDPATVAAGHWYFDRADAALVYRVRNAEFFRSPLPGPARVRLRLDLLFDDLDENGEYNPGAEQLSGVVLRPLDDFQWIGMGNGS